MGRFIDLSGQRFGRLVVIERVPNLGKDSRWKCRCDCGNYTEVSTANLHRGHVTSCGCYRKDKTKEVHSIEIVGKVFGKLTVLQKIRDDKRSKCYCRCACGKFRTVTLDKLTSGKVTCCKDCVVRDRSGKDKYRVFPEWFSDILINPNDKRDFSNGVLRTRNEDNSWRKIECKCTKCGKIHTQYVYKFCNSYKHTNGYCSACQYSVSQSPLEKEIRDYLSSITDSCITCNCRGIIDFVSDKKNPLELDIFIPDYRLAIEVNGSFWHSTKGGLSRKLKDYHFLKYKLCKEQGIHLISVFDIDWWYRKDKVKSILSSLIIKPQLLYARNTVVKPIDKSIGREFFNQYHLDGDTRQSLYYYGLYSKENILLSVMAFGKLRGQNTLHTRENHYELTRFATLPNIKIVGGASKLLKAFEQEYHPEYLLAYSDNDYFTGNVYSQLGFSFSKYTDLDYYWFTPVGNKFLNRWQCQPKKLREKYPNIASKYTTAIEDNVMIELGYVKVYRTGQSVWEKNLISKK